MSPQGTRVGGLRTAPAVEGSGIVGGLVLGLCPYSFQTILSTLSLEIPQWTLLLGDGQIQLWPGLYRALLWHVESRPNQLAPSSPGEDVSFWRLHVAL